MGADQRFTTLIISFVDLSNDRLIDRGQVGHRALHKLSAPVGRIKLTMILEAVMPRMMGAAYGLLASNQYMRP